jgi:hypothetical protein
MGNFLIVFNPAAHSERVQILFAKSPDRIARLLAESTITDGDLSQQRTLGSHWSAVPEKASDSRKSLPTGESVRRRFRTNNRTSATRRQIFLSDSGGIMRFFFLLSESLS